MPRSFTFRILTAVVCLLALAGHVTAAEVDCDSRYCFSPVDFSGDAQPEGICITALPESCAGTLMLGSRVLQPGDILTMDQAAQMTFSPLKTPEDQTASLEYLPIFADRVEEPAQMTIHIRGKADKAPVAEDSTAETYKNLAGTGKLKVQDPEEQALTYTLVRQPKRGTVTIDADGTFTYTPKKNKVGVDSFTYTAADPAGNVSREATVTVTILKPSDAAQYTDTVGRDCRFTAEWMRHTGIFTGETLAQQPCFQPDRLVNRGEFVTMLVKTLDIPTDEYLTYTGYSDKVPVWLQPYLAAAIRAGVTAGLPYGDTFAADTAITGAEVSVLLQNALNLASAQEAAVSEPVPVWAADSLSAARSSGFALDAGSPLTREQAAQILYQASKLAQASDTLV